MSKYVFAGTKKQTFDKSRYARKLEINGLREIYRCCEFVGYFSIRYN